MLKSSFFPFAAFFAFQETALSLPVSDLLSHTAHIKTPSSSVPRLIQYVQTFNPENNETGYLSLLPLLYQGTAVTHVILAALHVDGSDGNITLNDNNPNSTYYDQIWSEVSFLQQNGVKVMVMIGGAARGSYNGRICSKADGSIQDDYYLPLESTLKYHKIDGIDLDIEENVPISCPQNLANRIRADFGDDFIITMAPVASDLTSDGPSALAGFSYKQFDKSSAGKNIHWYNVQYYSGFVQGSLEQSYSNAISNGYSPERLVMGVLGSTNSGTGLIGLDAVKATIENLKDNYNNFGGIDGWEYFDAGSSDGLSQPWMWTKQIGEALFATSTKHRHRNAHNRHGRYLHRTPSLPTDVAELMTEGYDHISAAKAMRLANGDENVARNILTWS